MATAPVKPVNSTGQAWRVTASQESDNLAQNSGGGACGGALDGYSELMDNTGLGHLPCSTMLMISANGKTIQARKVDTGHGSSFNPVMGLYPRVSEALFGTRNGGSFTVTIWRADGGPLHPAGGTPVGVPSGTPVSGSSSTSPTGTPGSSPTAGQATSAIGGALSTVGIAAIAIAVLALTFGIIAVIW